MSASQSSAVFTQVADDIRGFSPWLRQVAVLIGDVAALSIALALALGIRWLIGGIFTFEQYVALWPLPLLVVGLFASFKLYADLPPSASEELRRICHGLTLGFVLLGTVTFLLRSGTLYSRSALIGAWALALVLVPVMRVLLRRRFARASWWGTPAVILGAGRTAELLVRVFSSNPTLGVRPVLVLDDDQAKHSTQLYGIPVLGPIDELAPQAHAAGIALAFLAMPGASQERLTSLWRTHGPRFPHLVVVPALYGFASLWVEAKDFGGVLGLELHQSLLLPWRRACKRALDLSLVVLGGIVVVPLLLVIALLVKVTSAGPLIYGQSRIGQGGRAFTAWKFRTMRRDADAVLAQLLAADPVLRGEWERDHKLRVDPRVTWVGSILRKTSLDELPQLWNVLVGEMSLVGPRPITTAEIPKYGDQWEVYLRVLPGVTGLWQVSGRNQTTYDERVALDTFYVHNWSPWLDLVILARTVQTVVRAEGAY